MNKINKIVLAGLALVAPVSAYALPVWEIPSADIVTLKSDFVTAGGVIMGLAVLFMAYRFIKRLIK